ncbi:hypothetical protein, variant 1 [Phytophthora nicotianae]|uniref:Uncharacterized protein n=6 Tax=Phytophthora nicotianae TaxID=4792 RepID=W2P9U0_PHYN3|nr:hypothetical protein PPTG_24828 [Phytophthora nicotianae INRA-310]ETK70685.1 hypothetical protein, variant 1 [Phytophthora nicotianae]ETM97782.1 hypothetical protein PPTG_24828 [Phytophthora nicotianae INRA-310]
MLLLIQSLSLRELHARRTQYWNMYMKPEAVRPQILLTPILYVMKRSYRFSITTWCHEEKLQVFDHYLVFFQLTLEVKSSVELWGIELR